MEGLRGLPTPPEHLVTLVGGGDYRRVGREFRGYFVEMLGLRPTARVLEVGCGSGRMAVPLTRHLRRGSYEGFDVHAEAIGWCQRHITARHPNFRFEHADIFNTWYNPEGRWRASEYRFPYDDARFDAVLLTSVFTHLLPADMDHYQREVARVLRPGGRMFATFFLLNDESRRLLESGRSTLALDTVLDGCRVHDRCLPEFAVGHDEERVRRHLEACGLHIQEPVRPGSWCGRSSFVSYQDIVIAVRGEPAPEAEADAAAGGWDAMSPKRRRMAAHLRGDGIEIGALNAPLAVPPGARVTYVDRLDLPELRRHYPELDAIRLQAPSVTAEAEDLRPFADGSLDFVIANHLLEHVEDPVRALREFLRVLRPGGLLYLALPDSRVTFDSQREPTTTEHLLEEYRHGATDNRWLHYRDYVDNVHFVVNPELRATESVDRCAATLMDMGYSIHFHVWHPETFLEFLYAAKAEAGLEFELAAFTAQEEERDNEFILLLRRR